MEEERRHRNYTVPIIGGLFFLVTIAGGILLIVWLIDGNNTHPWMPATALVLLGIPWAFWFVTYIYTFIKLWVRRRNAARGANRALNFSNAESRQSTLPKPTTPASNVGGTPFTDESLEEKSSSNGQRRVQFQPVVVVHGDSQRGHNDQSASSPESERPLTQSVG